MKTLTDWIPAFAGMTTVSVLLLLVLRHESYNT